MILGFEIAPHLVGKYIIPGSKSIPQYYSVVMYIHRQKKRRLQCKKKHIPKCAMALEYLPKKQPIPLCLMLVETFEVCQINIFSPLHCSIFPTKKSSFKWLYEMLMILLCNLALFLCFLSAFQAFSPNKNPSNLSVTFPWFLVPPVVSGDPWKGLRLQDLTMRRELHQFQILLGNEKLAPFSSTVCQGDFFWLVVNMDVSKNKGTPKWMVYNGKPY